MTASDSTKNRKKLWVDKVRAAEEGEYPLKHHLESDEWYLGQLR